MTGLFSNPQGKRKGLFSPSADLQSPLHSSIRDKEGGGRGELGSKGSSYCQCPFITFQERVYAGNKLSTVYAQWADADDTDGKRAQRCGQQRIAFNEKDYVKHPLGQKPWEFCLLKNDIFCHHDISRFDSHIKQYKTAR